MWPFSRKNRVEELLQDTGNNTAQRSLERYYDAIQKAQEYPGDQFQVKQEEPMTQATEVTTKKATIEQLPILVYRSVDTLNDKRKEIEEDLKTLKAKYEADRKELNDKLKLVNTSIRAWEAAKAVYDEDKTEEPKDLLDGIPPTATRLAEPYRGPNRTRRKK